MQKFFDAHEQKQGNSSIQMSVCREMDADGDYPSVSIIGVNEKMFVSGFLLCASMHCSLEANNMEFIGTYCIYIVEYNVRKLWK